MTVIDLQQIKAAREAPDTDCTERDQYGRPMKRFGLEYEMGGKLFVVHIDAYDLEDAERHAKAMREGISVYGQIYSLGTQA